MTYTTMAGTTWSYDIREHRDGYECFKHVLIWRNGVCRGFCVDAKPKMYELLNKCIDMYCEEHGDKRLLADHLQMMYEML